MYAFAPDIVRGVSTSKEQILIDRRYAAVLATISDDSLAAMASALPEKLRDPFAKVAGLPAGALSTKEGLGAKFVQASTLVSRLSMSAFYSVSHAPNIASKNSAVPQMTQMSST